MQRFKIWVDFCLKFQKDQPIDMREIEEVRKRVKEERKRKEIEIGHMIIKSL